LRKPWETPYRSACFLFSYPKLVHLLKIQPEISAATKEICQAKRAITGNCTLTIQHSGYPVGRDFELAAELRCAHSEFIELRGEMLAGVNSGTCHDFFP